MIIAYIQSNFKSVKVSYIIHSGRQHGLTPTVMMQLNEQLPDFLIIPDASSGDFEQHAELKSKGVDVLILDHHNVDRESLEAVVISNHPNISPDYKNRELSGAGIVLKFIEALDKEYGINTSEEYYAHAAVGIVADMMPLLHPETRYYVYKGLQNVGNPFLRQLIYKNAYHALKEAYPKVVSWNMSNYKNAIIRMGKPEDKELMLRSLLNEKETLERVSKYRGVSRDVVEEIHETTYRIASNARNRQNTAKRKLIQQAKDIIEQDNLNENPIIVVVLDNMIEGFSGFIGGDLSNLYKKPVIVLSKSGTREVYTGSGRGLDTVMLDTRKFIEDLGVFNFSSGHKQAFGVSIDVDKLDDVNKLIREKMETKSIPLEVDFVINSKSLNESLVREFYEYENLWCVGFEEPLVAIQSIKLDCKSIVFGNTMKFSVGNVEVMAFQVDEELQMLAEQNKTVVIDVIGTLGINTWLGVETAQVKIEAISIKSIEDTPSFGGFVF